MGISLEHKIHSNNKYQRPERKATRTNQFQSIRVGNDQGWQNGVSVTDSTKIAASLPDSWKVEKGVNWNVTLIRQ